MMIIEYDAEEWEVADWLFKNIEYDSISDDRMMAFDSWHRVIYGIYRLSKSVYFLREEDTTLFVMRWA